jgi:DNA-directed RNA polymerase subunit M/transcription elongation factor TFIIS
MLGCPECGANLKFSSEENEMVCEMCGYISEGGPEELTPSKMAKLLSANAQAHSVRMYYRPLLKGRARSARELAVETN